jgi:hypothetical protein
MAAQSDGEQKLIINTGSFALYFPGEHPDGTAANRFDIDRDLFLLPKQSARAVYDATTARWRIWVEGSERGRGRRVDYNWSPGSISLGDFGEWSFSTGTGSIAGNAATVADVGQNSAAIHTSTSSTGAAAAYFAKQIATVGETGVNHIYGSALISLEDLSTSGERYTFQHALTSGAGGTTLDVNNSLGIRYSDNLNSGKFQLFTRNTSGTESTADSGVTVAADQLYELFVSVDKSLSEARFYINGAMVGRITTNLPATATGLGSREIIVKSVGTTQRNAYIHNMSAGAVNP